MESNFTWTEVGCRLRDWRSAAGLSQRGLAEKAGLTQPGLHAIEAGITNPQLDSLERLASALGRSTRELILGVKRGPKEDTRMKRLERVLASGDTAAIAAAEQGLQLAESLLERRSHGLRLARPELNEQYKDSFEVPPGSTWKYVKGERGFRRTLVTPARAPVKKT